MRLSINGVPISYSGNSDDENNASIFGTAIIELVIGDKVSTLLITTWKLEITYFGLNIPLFLGMGCY